MAIEVGEGEDVGASEGESLPAWYRALFAAAVYNSDSFTGPWMGR